MNLEALLNEIIVIGYKAIEHKDLLNPQDEKQLSKLQDDIADYCFKANCVNGVSAEELHKVAARMGVYLEWHRKNQPHISYLGVKGIGMEFIFNL